MAQTLRALRDRRVDLLGQSGGKLNNDPASTTGNRSNAHRKRTVSSGDERVNTVMAAVQQFVSMADRNALGPLVASLREERGLTQAELGKAIGLSRQRVTQLEGGRTQWPSSEIFNALAVALDVPVTVLLRAAGVAMPVPEEGYEKLTWAISQMDSDGREQLADIAYAILPRHRRRPETAAP